MCLAKRSQSDPGYLLSLFIRALRLSSHLAQISIHTEIFSRPQTQPDSILCFFLLPFCPDTSFLCADPQTLDAEYHSIQDSILILPGTAQGTFSAKPCLVLSPAFVYGGFIYVVLSLVQYQFYRK